jgi:hypothetical protein
MKALSSYKISLLLLLAASQSLSFIDRVNLSVVLPELIKEHAYTPATAGLLMSILNWFYVGAIILAGPLTDKIGAHRAFPGAVALWSLATAICGLTIQFWPLAILRAMVGIGEAPNIPSGSQVIQRNFEKTERGFAVSVQFSGNKIGLAIGIPLSAFLLSQFGRPSVFYMTGLLGALWVLGWMLIYRKPDTATEGVAAIPQPDPLARTAEGPIHLGDGSRASWLSLRLLRLGNMAAGLSRAPATHVNHAYGLFRDAAVRVRHRLHAVWRLGRRSTHRLGIQHIVGAQILCGRRHLRLDHLHRRGGAVSRNLGGYRRVHTRRVPAQSDDGIRKRHANRCRTTSTRIFLRVDSKLRREYWRGAGAARYRPVDLLDREFRGAAAVHGRRRACVRLRRVRTCRQ